jgi:hypothetical protein
MKKWTASLMLAAFGALVSFNALAQNANPCPSDKSYQVNIIGVSHDKSADMTGNSGHRIFVPLNSGEDVGRHVRIYMTGDTDSETNGLQCGNSFQVLDANATDDDEATLLVPCEPIEVGDPGICFDVYATGLGTPGGNANVDVVCEFDISCVDCDITDPNAEGDTCAMGNIDFDVARGKGKPVTEDITNVFRASGCIDADTTDLLECGDAAEDIIFTNVWIFNVEQLLTYFWDYDNNGLKVMQVRFCDSVFCGSVVAGG